MTYSIIEDQERTGTSPLRLLFALFFNADPRNANTIVPSQPAVGGGGSGMLNRFGDTTNARAYPAGQTLVQSPSFRQTAPEFRDCPGFAAYFGTPPPRRLSSRARGVKAPVGGGWVWGLMERSRFGVKWFGVRGVERGD